MTEVFENFETKDIKDLLKSDKDKQIYEIIKPIFEETLIIINSNQNLSKGIVIGENVAMALAITFNKRFKVQKKVNDENMSKP